MNLQAANWVIKLGGRGLIDPATLTLIASQIAELKRMGINVVVVHGGGPAINEELTRRGITWNFVEGQRVTTPEMMDVIEMVLCGCMNRKVVRALQAAGADAVGFSGIDGGTLQCSQLHPELQQVGKIEKVDSRWINGVIRAGGVPVIAPIGGSLSQGSSSKESSPSVAYNINADWAAASVAEALQVSTLIFMTDQDGIWGADGSVQAMIDESGLEQLIASEVVTGGMLAKTRTILHALRAGVNDVRVLNAKNGLWAGGGTACRLTVTSTENRLPSQAPEITQNKSAEVAP